MTTIAPFGESALQVVLGEVDDEMTLPRVHALAQRVAVDRAAGQPWGAAVPGLTTLLVPFEPRAWSIDEAKARLLTQLADLSVEAGERHPETHRIPVRYGGEAGPDLATVAERLGLTPDQVIELHTSAIYRVAIVGFMPGFAYLGDLPEALRLPRRDTPRARVPAGSVAIAERQTAIYPATTPGGWHLLGRTDVRPWDIEHDPPGLLRPGDQVRFEPVS
jgi:KipI family sensor histidine kinase inhibitor